VSKYVWGGVIGANNKLSNLIIPFLENLFVDSHSEMFCSNIVQDVQGWYMGTPEEVRQDAVSSGSY
jgi:hypothetical protein